MTVYLFILVSLINYAIIKGQFNDCQTRESCTECISSGPKCSWCEDIIYQSGEKTYYHKKCDVLSNHVKQGCKNVTNPQSSSVILESSELGGTTRVFPKKVSVKLRPGQPTTVEVKVKTPKNFPIDLYYLMDLSLSMKNDLDQIKTLGNILSEQMKKVTSEFRLGFGGFVDKPLGPYTRTNPKEIETIEREQDAQYTFAFKNYLPLTSDVSLFDSTLKNVKISFNVDIPESTLEALMQVIVCEKAVGWREKQSARRIVIITTDANFHIAGDGLLGGLVIPNDGHCHLINNTYDAWRRFDYPSLSQIRAIMVENQITPIFATTGNTTELYDRVAEFFGAASGAVADQLNEDSTNVVPLIKEAYEKIAKIVSINADAPKQIDVKYTTVCGVNKEPQNENFCNDVAIGQTVTFKVDLTAKDCSLPKNTNFKIKTSFDDIDVQLELLCECPCAENKKATVSNSSDCSGRGELVCGQCQCDPVLYAGRFCQCTVEESKNQSLCLQAGSDAICSDQGVCECGECRCQPPQVNQNKEIVYYYSDKTVNQCQCTNTSCGRIGGLLCGGPDKGRCDCGQCICNKAWQGPTCSEECVDSTAACFDDTGVECSGKGKCVCNECQCDKGFSGDLCDECVKNCPDPCQDYRECVRCRVLKTSDLSKDDCDAECDRWNITSHIVKEKIPEDEKRCISRDDDDCSFVFTYNKDNVTNVVQLIVQQERICPAEPDILAIILGVIAGIIGIGLALLLIWKLLATIQDRRDFAKFEKDRQNPKWDSGENPIYKEAISTFQNPTYGNKDT